MIIVGVTFVQHPQGDVKQERGVSAGASCCLRCVTRRHKASFRHNIGSPVAPWPSFFSTPFFCVLNVSITKVAAESSLSVVVAVSNNLRPKLKVTSDRRKGELSDLVPVYSPGRRRKKKVIMIMSATACSSWSVESAAK